LYNEGGGDYMQAIYGPVASRRLGQSLGISPMTLKTCNYNCIYCQLGSTHYLTNHFQAFMQVESILESFDEFLEKKMPFDVVSIVGNGEPTLYDDLTKLVEGIKLRTNKPICLITNGALLYEENVIKACNLCDIVLPSLNGFDPISHLKINRPHKALDYHKVLNALIDFSLQYKGKLWLEIMVIKGINDHDEAINAYKHILSKIKYDRLYLNVPVRAPSEKWVEIPDKERLIKMRDALNGTLIDYLESPNYHDAIEDDYLALKNLLRYHPLHQFEIKAFLSNRNTAYQTIIAQLEADNNVQKSIYKGLISYRIKA
jgi:wyosine [tRNA(Phe)-imidazoG37] synthetase (radical SAM superfamily)